MLDVKPHEFIRYGLGCLEMLAGLGDSCADDTRGRLRIMVCSMFITTTTYAHFFAHPLVDECVLI